MGYYPLMDFEQLRMAKQKEIERQAIELQQQAEKKQKINSPEFWRELLKDHEAAINMWQSSSFPQALRTLQSLVKEGVLEGGSLTISPYNMVAHRNNLSKYRDNYGYFYAQSTNKSHNEDEILIGGVTVGAIASWDSMARYEAETDTRRSRATYGKWFDIYVSKKPNGIISNTIYHRGGWEVKEPNKLFTSILERNCERKEEYLAIPNWQNTSQKKAEEILLTAFNHPRVGLTASHTEYGNFSNPICPNS